MKKIYNEWVIKTPWDLLKYRVFIGVPIILLLFFIVWFLFLGPIRNATLSTTLLVSKVVLSTFLIYSIVLYAIAIYVGLIEYYRLLKIELINNPEFIELLKENLDKGNISANKIRIKGLEGEWLLLNDLGVRVRSCDAYEICDNWKNPMGYNGAIIINIIKLKKRANLIKAADIIDRFIVKYQKQITFNIDDFNK